MVDAVAVVAVAAAAVAEFQIRVRIIGASTDGAAVVVGRFGLGHSGLVRAGGGEGNDLGRLGRFFRLLPEQPAEIGSPG